jgi:hypothetical protein
VTDEAIHHARHRRQERSRGGVSSGVPDAKTRASSREVNTRRDEAEIAPACSGTAPGSSSPVTASCAVRPRDFASDSLRFQMMPTFLVTSPCEGEGT